MYKSRRHCMLPVPGSGSGARMGGHRRAPQSRTPPHWPHVGSAILSYLTRSADARRKRTWDVEYVQGLFRAGWLSRPVFVLVV